MEGREGAAGGVSEVETFSSKEGGVKGGVGPVEDKKSGRGSGSELEFESTLLSAITSAVVSRGEASAPSRSSETIWSYVDDRKFH